MTLQELLDEFLFRPTDAPGEAVPPKGLAAPAGGPRRYLGFRLGGQPVAMALEALVEILRGAQVTFVPRAPPSLVGVVSHRGQVLPVFDLREKVAPGAGAREDGAPRARILVVRGEAGEVGLWADAVDQVVRSPAENAAGYRVLRPEEVA